MNIRFRPKADFVGDTAMAMARVSMCVLRKRMDRGVRQPGPATRSRPTWSEDRYVANLDPPASLMRWLTAHARQARRYGSICSGAFLLAAACWTGEDLGVAHLMGERG